MIYADQYVYIDELKHVKLKPEQALPKDELLSKDEVKSVKAVAGQLLWRCSKISPDITLDSYAASNYGKAPKVKCIATTNKAVEKVRRTS